MRGPIEAWRPVHENAHPPTFRAIKCAVPLKPVKHGLLAGVRDALPRDQMRGPIEAFLMEFAEYTQQCLPRDQMRGPIEASE